MNRIKEKLDVSFGYHKTGLKLLKVIHSMDSTAIPTAIIYSVLDAAFPYIGFIMTAAIIDRLLVGEYRSALITAAVLIACNFILGIIISYLNELVRYKGTLLFHKLPILMRRKAMDLDYATMEKAEVKEKITHTEYTTMLNGGLDTILDFYRKLLGAVLSVITSLAMVVMLCLSYPRENMGLIAYLGRPIIIAPVFIILMVAIVRTSIKEYSKYGVKEKELFENHTDVEIGAVYLSRKVVFNYGSGKVIRLFNMKNMIMENYRKHVQSTSKFYEAMVDVSGGSSLPRWVLIAYIQFSRMPLYW